MNILSNVIIYTGAIIGLLAVICGLSLIGFKLVDIFCKELKLYKEFVEFVYEKRKKKHLNK